MGYVETIEPGTFTIADLDDLPDDGMRYELVDGTLLVAPAPLPIHQTAAFELGVQLRLHCPKDLKVFMAPTDFQPTARRSLQPDVLVCRRADVGPKAIQRSLLLAAEVLSPATRSKDLLFKRGLYEEAGVQSYWIVDPDRVELTVLELVAGRYVQRAKVRGKDTFTADLPFTVQIVPADLID
ncbi:Uma2 family endonuclease [Kribbella solani]|uniref:Uma2 family endonuclease n=1 Tax=Kribbella solani TaxID=236067 RepID=UPI0029B08F29|nr:Uma2 family endonuclease [Kribbella solani]MDX3002922.1 Uma2 family endonuclease [Kribbella solani]